MRLIQTGSFLTIYNQTLKSFVITHYNIIYTTEKYSPNYQDIQKQPSSFCEALVLHKYTLTST